MGSLQAGHAGWIVKQGGGIVGFGGAGVGGGLGRDALGTEVITLRSWPHSTQ